MDKKLCKCLWKNCNFAFSEEKETFEHVFTTHSVKGRQDCLWISNHFKGPCNERFKHKGQFKDHLVTHFSLDFRPLACPFCCKRLRSRQELGKHKKTHTTNSQPLQKNSETTNTFNNQINSTQFQAPIISIKSLITNNYNYSSIVSIPCIKSEPNINLTSFLYTAKNRISPLTMTHTSISALELSCNDQPVVDYSHVKGKERLSDRNNCQIVKIIPCVEEKKYKNQNFEDLELLCNTAIATHYKVPNNLSLTHEIGFNICMVLGLSEMFNKDYGIIIPEDFKNMIIAIFKREGSHGRVPPNYLRLLDTLWRRTPYALPFKQQMEEKYHVQDQIKRSKKIFNVMFKNFTAVLRKVLKLELDNLNDQGYRIEKKQYFPLHNLNFPIKKFLIIIARIVKETLLTFNTNEDTVELFEPSTGSLLFNGQDCSKQFLILKYKLQNYYDYKDSMKQIIFEIKKNLFLTTNVEEIFKNEINLILRELFFDADSYYNRNCCSGLFCSKFLCFNWDVVDFSNLKTETLTLEEKRLLKMDEFYIFFNLNGKRDQEQLQDPIELQQFSFQKEFYLENFFNLLTHKILL